MEQLLEFIGNHPLLVVAAIGTGAMLLFYEFRMAGQGRFALSPDQAVRLINKGALVLDLRSPEDYATGHLSGARNLQLSELESQLASLKKYRRKPVIAYDQRGAGTMRAISLLRGAEFEQVFSLRGGVTAWREEHLPLERDGKGKGK